MSEMAFGYYFSVARRKFTIANIFVYREGDIVKQPMKKGSFVPKNVPGVGGMGGSCRGGVGHVGLGWGGSCRGGVGHAGVGWVM